MTYRRTQVAAQGIALYTALALFCAFGGTARAQTANDAETVAKLKRPVSIRLEDTTLAQAAKTLSDQTGLRVVAEPYLAARVLTLQLENLPARDALDALAELGGWAWHEEGKGSLRITRRVLRLPQRPAAVPRLMQNAFPRDWRDFLNIPTPDEDMRQYRPLILRDVATVMERSQQFSRRLLRLSGWYSQQVYDAVKPEDVDKEDIPFDRLTPKQREALVGLLLRRCLDGMREVFLLGDLPPHVADPASATLEVRGDGLFMILSHVQRPDGSESSTGFGVPVQRPGK